VEGTLHGALQAGYNNGWAPLCIGSHYAVRTSALWEIGGLGPELAEDHSTTLFMNAHGWRGVHAIDAIAHGEGPRTFADLVTQEFQWSRSLAMILLQYSPGCIPKLSARLRFQFLFSQLWYPLFSFFMLLAFSMPVAALVFDFNFVDVAFIDFVKHSIPMSLLLIAMSFRWKAGGWCRPVDARVLSWEGALFQFARWPWALAGTLAALRDCATGSVVEFRVTPKGSDAVSHLPFRVLAPYVLLSLVSAIPVLLLDQIEAARGFYIFALLNAALYAVLLLVIVVRHGRENAILPYRPLGPFFIRQGGLALTLSSLVLCAGLIRGAQGVEALTWGADGFNLTTASYSIAGAGQGGAGVRKVSFFPVWTAPTHASGSPYPSLRKSITE
jgi:hypothetical protein